jgi:hypothetical protein
MDKIIFSDTIDFIDGASSFKAALKSGIDGVDDLFASLYTTLRFPTYFGDNWNAVSDCLRDFHWMEEKNIVLIHTDMPKLIPEDMEIYIDVLRTSIIDWKEGEDHALYVVFPPSAKETVLSFLKT